MDIQKADPQARRRAMLAVIIAIPTAMVARYFLQTHQSSLIDWIRRDPKTTVARVRLVFAFIAVSLSGPVLIFSGYLWQFGRRTKETLRFPPAGTAVLHDTPILSGGRARRRGQALQLIAGFLTLAAMAMAFFLWRLAALTPGPSLHP